MRIAFLTATAAALVTLSGCVAPSRPPAPAPAAPVPVPTPAPPPAPALTGDWRDWPITPGDWRWQQDVRGSLAVYGAEGGRPELALRCDRQRGRVYLSRRVNAAGAGALTIRTTSAVRALPAVFAAGDPAWLVAELGVRDSILDAIGYSRGRFIVEAPGLPPLVVPAWSETLRVTEDCR